jgi:long-chain acyl-CoA synthetase
MSDKRWLLHYDKGIPASLQPYPDCTLVDILQQTAAERPEHPAMLFKGRSISSSELDRLSTAFASALVGLGVKKGDRVGLVLPNAPQLVIGLLGAWKVGAIAVPLNPLYTESELEHALKYCAAQVVLVLTPFYNKVKAIQPHTQVRRLIATNVKEYLPPLTRSLFTLFKEKKDGHRIRLETGDDWLPALLSQFGGATQTPLRPAPNDPAILIFTGGTTGTPKAAIGTHRALFISGMQIRAWFKNVLIDWDDIIMLNMPLFHAYGLAGVFSTGIVAHTPFAVIPNPRDLEDMLDTIQKVRPAFLPGVPTLFNALLNHPRVRSGQVDLRCLKLSLSGASPLLAEIKEGFERVTGGRIAEGYALTETMMGLVMSPIQGWYKPGSVGIPLPDIEMRITDADSGQGDLPCGQVGEILLRAPQLMTGYWEKPDETADMLRDGWLFTGDLGYMDEDGYLFIVDRKKDVIKPSGFQVWPREVEEVIASHPAVMEVGVAGVPDPRQVEAVKAWVVLHAGQEVTAGDLQDYCRQKLAAYKVPKYIEFRESLPKSTIGKILRRELTANG